MNILYIGDVMGESGIRVVEQVLPKLRTDKKIDLVIAQAENVSDGRGIKFADFKRLQKMGVDFCSGGNWSLHDKSIIPLMNDPAQPIIRPANYPEGTPGLGWKYAATPKGRVLIVSLLGKIVGRDSDKEVDNPLKVIDQILESQKGEPKVATIVNFHGDFSSEKVVIGHYLDGRVTAVVGDHWHVPTADARVLPGGTAHITDVGMCGALNSSLGVKYYVIEERWLSGKPSRNLLETEGPLQFNAVLVEANDQTGLAKSIKPINLTLT
ncbi:MAG TPA: TIGR00282 family metallophosphoesterase [Candidatus Saccharimonadales bacterium]|nr:TIGR00282 family metallophosphoesterase [Candidatus Saccharimonadales bacterium]